MLTLVEQDRHTLVQDANLLEKQIIREAIHARPKGYRFMPAYKAGSWDGYISLYKDSKFPSGLLKIVMDALSAASVEYQIDFNADTPQPTNSIEVSGYNLREYQQEAVVSALTATRGVLHMATNAGKTLIMASIIQATGNRAIVIVPTRALLMQTAEKLEEMLQIPIGRYGAGNEDLLPVTVTTMASLPKLVKEDLEGNITVVCDEAHHTRADTVFDNIFKIPGPYRYGMSGTPMTYDALSDLKLIGATGPVIYTVRNEELINLGFSVPPDIRFLEVDEPDMWDADYDTAYRECIVGNDLRNEMLARVAKEAARPVMILVNWIEHVDALVYHITCMKITGQDHTARIQAVLDGMRDGDVDILVATDIFGEGIDVPSIRTLILAGGGKSHIKLLQRVGRGLRQADNKDQLVVYDFIDDTNKFLMRHSERRYKLYKEESFSVSLQT